MARGWESKAVADQMEEAQRLSPGEPTKHTADPELEQRRATLQLARSHIVAQLQRARAEGHRELLRRSLDEIDRQLAELNRPLSSDF